jgi:hypothetical protein
MTRRHNEPSAELRETLETLRSLGGREQPTRAIAAAFIPPRNLLWTKKRLRELEARGLVTCSSSLDGLERLWSIDKAGAK